jgi:hypothetical protein
MAYSGPWRVARSLDILLGQINALAPTRSKASDGSIADDLHSTTSDHYPKVISGLGATPTVTARDFTHDPADGADMNVIAEQLRLSRDKRVKYAIWNRRIFSGPAGPQPWVWRAYSGDNPHDKHMHVSVVASAAADDTNRWDIGEENDMLPDERAALMAVRDALLKPDAVLDNRPLRTALSDVAFSLVYGKSENTWVGRKFAEQRLRDEALLAAVQADADVATILTRVDQRAAELAAGQQALRAELVADLGPALVAALREELGDIPVAAIEVATASAVRSVLGSLNDTPRG